MAIESLIKPGFLPLSEVSSQGFDRTAEALFWRHQMTEIIRLKSTGQEIFLIPNISCYQNRACFLRPFTGLEGSNSNDKGEILELRKGSITVDSLP